MGSWQRKAAGVQQEAEERSTARRLAEQATDPVEKFRYLCLAREFTGILNVGRLFRRMDDDGNKLLDFDEFYKGITESGLSLTEDQAREMFDRFDLDGNGTIDITEFLTALRPLSDARKRVLKLAFQKMDQNGDGVITVDDLKTTYSVEQHPRYLSGEDTKEDILSQFLAIFEKGAIVDGRVTEEEFMNYYAGISASIEYDIYFDLMIRVAYKL